MNTTEDKSKISFEEYLKEVCYNINISRYSIRGLLSTINDIARCYFAGLSVEECIESVFN